MKQIQKIKRLLTFSTAFLLSLSSLAVMSPIAQAAVDVCTWTGATNLNFNTATNWSCATDGAAVPENGDSLVFDSTSLTESKELNNDIAGASFAAITFSGNNNDHRLTLTGNAMMVSNSINSSTTLISQIDNNLTLGGNITIGGTGSLGLGDYDNPGTLNMNGNDITTVGSTYLDIGHVVSGNGDITAAGYLNIFSANPAWTGEVSLGGSGHLTLYKPNSLGAASNHLTVPSGGSVFFCSAQGATIANPITIGGTGTTSSGSLYATFCGFGGGGPIDGPREEANFTLSGAIALTANTSIFTHGTLTITGAITGNHTLSVVKGSPGSVVLNSSSNASGTANGTYEAPVETITVEANDKTADSEYVTKNQTLVVDGERGDITVNGGATLKGTGKVGAITMSKNATIAPGHSPGCLASGDLIENGTYQAEIGGTTACSGYDQLTVTGTVTLDAATSKLNVTLFGGFKPAKDNTFTIISNDAADAVTGTFNGLDEGATFAADGSTFKISYKGGDGNDVVLTVIVAGTPNSGFSLTTASPILTIGLATLAAGALYVVGRRYARVYIKF